MAKKENDQRTKREVEMVFKCAELIMDSIRIGTTLQQIAGMEPCDILTSAVLAFGDTIVALADAAGEPREKTLKVFVSCLKDHVRNAEKPTNKGAS